MASSKIYEFPAFDFSKAVPNFKDFDAEHVSAAPKAAVQYWTSVSDVLIAAGKNNVEVTKDWSLETVEVARDLLDTPAKAADAAKSVAAATSENFENAATYIPKYAEVAYETNAGLWAAWLGLFNKGETVAPVTATETAPVAEVEIAAPAFVDDIELIDGIGPVIAKKLRSRGINSLYQIAKLTEEAIETLEVEMAFKGRVARDEWVEQAQEMIDGKAPRAKIDQAKLT